MDNEKLKQMLGNESFQILKEWESENGIEIYPDQPESSKREDLVKELDKFKPKSLKPEDGYFPPPWNINDHLEKTIGWLEFQKAMKDDPNSYSRCGTPNS